VSADLTQLMQASVGPAPLPPAAAPTSAVDPALGAPMPPDPFGAGAGLMQMGGMGAYPSTDAMMLTQAVQETLASMAAADTQALEAQQAAAAAQAQPLIDQMLQNAALAQAAPPAPMMGAPDPAMAFGEQEGLPPLPPEGMGI